MNLRFFNFLFLKKAIRIIFSEPKYIYLRYRYWNSFIHTKSDLSYKDLNSFVLGSGSYIGAFTVIKVFDNNDNSFLGSKLIIGNNTYIGELNNIRACGGIISIGNNCLISQQVSLIASNHKYDIKMLIKDQKWSTENNFISIGNDVWIGANVVILPGVKLGDGVIIGAGSVVTKSFESNLVIAGNPARIIKSRNSESVVSEKLN